MKVWKEVKFRVDSVFTGWRISQITKV